MINLQAVLSALSQASPAQKAEILQLVGEWERRHREERGRFFVPVRPTDPNAFGIPSNDQWGAWYSTADEIWNLGGNRTGKTELVVQTVDAFCNGRHPIRNGYGQIRRADGSYLVQKMPPVKGRYCAPKWRDGVLNVILGKFKSVVRRSELRGGSWRKAWSEAEHKLYYANGSTIHFKSGEEDRDTFGGDDLDFVAQDERLSQDKFNENTARLVDRRGFYIAALTPEVGITWERDHVEMPPKGVLVEYRYFKMKGNPHLDPLAVRQFEAKIRDPRVRKVKMEGEFVALFGQVLPQWNAAVHVVPDFKIPKTWPRVLCGDFHRKVPSAVMWMAWDPEGALVVYRTAKEKLTVPEWKQFIRAKSGDEKFAAYLSDEPDGGEGTDINGFESIAAQFRQNQEGNPPIPFHQVEKPAGSFDADIFRLWDMLSQDPMTGKSRIKVFESTNWPVKYIEGKPHGSLAWEIERWQWKSESKADEENLREKARDVNNHLISCLRYGSRQRLVHAGELKIRSALGS